MTRHRTPPARYASRITIRITIRNSYRRLAAQILGVLLLGCTPLAQAQQSTTAQDPLDLLLDADASAALQDDVGGTSGQAPGKAGDAGAGEPLPTIPVPATEAAAVQARAPTRAARGAIEEVVVTAQKREENLQDVPIAITAFSGARLEETGIQTTKDLGLVTPGLQITELAGYTFIYLRGVGSDAFVASADPSIATYVDGVYVPIGHGFAQELGGVERVEVLKGPQGTLFGRNSTGGAINVTTKKPSDSFEGSVGLSYGDFETYSAKGYVSMPIGDSLAVSAAGLLRGSQGYYTRKGPRAQRGIPDDEVTAWRLRGRWNPTHALELLLTAQRVEQTVPGSLISANTRPSPLGQLLLIQPETEDYVTRGDTDSLNDSYQESYYGQLTWSLPWLDVKLLGNDLLSDATALQTDFDGSPMPLVSFFSPHEYTDIQTWELQLLSNDGSWASDRLTWVAGLYYLKSTAGFDPVILEVADSVVQLPTGELISLIPDALLDLLPTLPAPGGIDIYLQGLLETESKSAYAQATWAFADWMSLTLGGRYQTELRRQSKSTVNVIDSQGGLFTLLSYRPQESEKRNFSPKATLDFRPAEDVLVYLSWAKGFKSHTYNIINIYTRPELIQPEELTSYELGIKSEFFGRSLRLNAAVFQNETDNLQSSFISLLAGGAVRLENAGGARSRGAELDISWLPIPDLDPGLSITGGVAYLDSIYTSFEDGSGFNEQTGLQQGNQDFSGNRVVRTPEWTASLGLSQRIDMDWGVIDLAADGYYNDGFYFLPQNGERSYEPSYSLLNARIGVMLDRWRLRLTVYGANLTDERYNIAQFHTDFGRNDTLAPPRNFGVRLNWEF